MQRFDDWQAPEIMDGVQTRWGWIVKCPENLTFGRNIDIGAFTYVGAHAGVAICDNVQIGGGCKIYSLSTIDNTRGQIIIKENAKIGANSVVLPDVVIGENSTVGALSLVKFGTRIPANEIWAGVPAKKIGDVANANTVL
jgi:acetyltransferase-like isoleucine patch superfamily enzyme